jgi:hypothetical protein
MKKTILILAFAVIASCASSQTLLSPSQMGVSTNDYSLISTNTAGHWPTLYFSVLTITNFIMESTVAQTNTLQIRWQAQP